MSEFVDSTTTAIALEEETGASSLTRRVYDALAPVYTIPTLLFHSRAHTAALKAARIADRSRVLEVAIGSGEMLRRIVEANPQGETVGVDLSPKMAARCQKGTNRTFPGSSVACQAADVRHLPLPDEHFDGVVCCYLFELLPDGDLTATLWELRRVLRPGGRLTVILIARNDRVFNAMYRVCSRVAPAFWGRQLDDDVANAIPHCGFTVDSDRYVRQLYYSSRVVSAVRI
jgi:ubiquinone/menaquinone biosynthesis C-methylase UbiE